MTDTSPGHSPPDDRLIRVVVNLPRSLVERLDRRTGPGRSRSALYRDILADAEQVAS